jgi:hypothetical protein
MTTGWAVFTLGIVMLSSPFYIQIFRAIANEWNSLLPDSKKTIIFCTIILAVLVWYGRDDIGLWLF